jgi:hypothetical protein
MLVVFHHAASEGEVGHLQERARTEKTSSRLVKYNPSKGRQAEPQSAFPELAVSTQTTVERALRQLVLRRS